MRRSRLFVGIMLSTIAGCGGPPPAAAPQTPPPPAPTESTKPAAPAPLVIKAALFPYIPDSAGDEFASLIAKLESGFEAAQPGVDLQITINGDLDFYDSSAGGTLSKLLGKGADAMQVVEVDTVLMGTLVDGSYKQGTGAETAFASGNAGGFIGYTKQLFAIRHANPSAPLPAVISAPIGDGSNPLMFVDALVFNPGCVGACLSAAQAFATYMSSVAVRNIIAFSQDGPQGTLPRYLLQANPSFYSSSPASSDPMYKAYTTIVNRATPFPNTGFPEGRTALNDALTAALTSAPAKQAPTKSLPAKPVKSTKSAAH